MQLRLLLRNRRAARVVGRESLVQAPAKLRSVEHQVEPFLDPLEHRVSR